MADRIYGHPERPRRDEPTEGEDRPAADPAPARDERTEPDRREEHPAPAEERTVRDDRGAMGAGREAPVRDDRGAMGAGREAPVRDDRETRDERRYRAPGDTVGRREPGRAHARDEFGGFNWGAAFFGWLVAVGLAAILTGILSAAGTALRLTEISEAEVEASADTIGIVGAVLLLLVLMLAYYAGGYVAGRMSRFDGARQGFGVWVFGVLLTIVLALLGIVADSEYNVLQKLDLPRIPIDEGDLTTGGVIALAAVLIGTLVAALAGGRLGERYHQRVDRAAYGA